jgi:hypothetical protein
MPSRRGQWRVRLRRFGTPLLVGGVGLVGVVTGVIVAADGAAAAGASATAGSVGVSPSRGTAPFKCSVGSARVPPGSRMVLR